MPLGKEFRAYRDEHRISQRELGDALGLSRHYVGQIERGYEPAEKVARKFRLMADRAAAPLSPPADNGVSAGKDASTPTRPFFPHADAPPLAEEPSPLSLEELELPKGSSRVLQMGPFETLELAMYHLLVGQDISYVRVHEGRPKRDTAHEPGIADMLPPAQGAIVRHHARKLAHDYTEWARQSPRVYGLLKGLFVGGPARQALTTTALVAYLCLAEAGVFPKPQDLVGSIVRPSTNGTDPNAAASHTAAPGTGQSPYPPPV